MRVRELIVALLEESMSASVHVLARGGDKHDALVRGKSVEAILIDGTTVDSDPYDVFLSPDKQLSVLDFNEVLEKAALQCEKRAESLVNGSAVANQCAADIRSLKA